MSRASPRKERQSLSRIFGIPAAMAVSSLAGLILALTGDGWRDVLAALLLLAPLFLFARAWLRRA
jgi:hypothetical protein